MRGGRGRGRRRGAGEYRYGVVRAFVGFREKLKRIVESKYFNRGIMIAILVNTLSMGIEYHEQVSGSLQLSLQFSICSSHAINKAKTLFALFSCLLKTDANLLPHSGRKTKPTEISPEVSCDLFFAPGSRANNSDTD